MILPPVRGLDAFGSGEFGASRGDRKHNGIDLACYPGSLVQSLTYGTITKLGYPYAAHTEYRYVEVDLDGNRIRYFYLEPSVSVGDSVHPGQVLGEAQELGRIYPGITEHCHLEIINAAGEYIDPRKIIRSLGQWAS